MERLGSLNPAVGKPCQARPGMARLPCGVAVRAAAYGVFRAAAAFPSRPPEEVFVVTRIPLLTLALATLVGVAAVSAQQRQITGQVTSAATREAVAGVNVSVTGTAFAAVTNAEGRSEEHTSELQSR